MTELYLNPYITLSFFSPPTWPNWNRSVRMYLFLKYALKTSPLFHIIVDSPIKFKDLHVEVNDGTVSLPGQETRRLWHRPALETPLIPFTPCWSLTTSHKVRQAGLPGARQAFTSQPASQLWRWFTNNNRINTGDLTCPQVISDQHQLQSPS